MLTFSEKNILPNTFQVSEWQAFKSEAGKFECPPETFDNTQCIKFTAPSTLAAALLEGGQQESDLGHLDHFDWWLNAEFFVDSENIEGLKWLVCEGLATLGELWLNGERLSGFDNMFLPLEVNVKGKLKAKNQIQIVIRSSHSYLSFRRSRPSWRTNLVDNQNLRWLRTSLLAYIPSWTPDIKPLGIYRDICFKSDNQQLLDAISVRSTFENHRAELYLTGQCQGDSELKELKFTIQGRTHCVPVTFQNGMLNVNECILLKGIQAWWPHTHGAPKLYDWTLGISDDVSSARRGRIGFKNVSVNREQGKVEFRINDIPVFIRGGCWTTSNIISLTEARESLKSKLLVLKNANMNAVRIGGTMLYENEDFYSLCDELGILVWQDFMFANMDYPIDDENFLQSINAEVNYQTQRFSSHVSVSVYCGGSEVEQQAAMMGVPQGQWRNAFFSDILPEICNKNHPGIPYFPSSPCEGDLPFFPSVGISHYFGVGAYQQGLSDLTKSEVKFASECLAFSNVPSEEHLVAHFGQANPSTTSPQWKRGVPRDNAVGWDFEDVRDHYCQKLFGVDPVHLRYENLEGYHKLARIVTGYLMAKSFLYWRSKSSDCSGGIVWFLNDILAGAGWGLIDSDGGAKPALRIAGQALEKYQCYVVNKGLEGHTFGVINESADVLECTLRALLIGHEGVAAEYNHALELNAWAEESVFLASLRGSFVDSAHYYRFGHEKFEAVAVQLFDKNGVLLSQDIDFPCGMPGSRKAIANIEAELMYAEEGSVFLHLSAESPLYYLNISSNNFVSEKDWFHLLPGQKVKIPITLNDLKSSKLRMNLQALNLEDAIRLVVSCT